MPNDSRPRCVLYVGDGFSRSLREHYGVGKEIVTWPLFPPPAHICYIPAKSTFPDQFDEHTKLADPQLFPALWKSWRDWQKNAAMPAAADAFLAFCTFFAAQERAFESGKSNGHSHLAFDRGSPGIQLRAYLWNLFKVYDHMFSEAVKRGSLDGWDWWPVIQMLAASTHLTVISYNYDTNIEGLLNTLKHPRFTVPVSDCVARIREGSQNEIIVLKPHGSIVHSLLSSIHGGPNPWLASENLFAFTDCKMDSPIDHSLNWCPILPDLVPPGHDYLHLANYDADIQDGIFEALRNAELLIWCGLSGREPDRSEFTKQLANLRLKTPVLHIGVESTNSQIGDDKGEAADLLRASSCIYTFRDKRHVYSIPIWVNAILAEISPGR